MIEVYSWGYGGGLVIHNNNGLLQKIELKIPDRIKQISIGSSRTLILTSNYDVYYLHHQKIEKMEVEKIEKMEVGEKIIKVGASFEHCLCISETGKAYSMGTNTYKQLGHTKVNSGKFELIKFFIEKNIKIRDFAIGCYQSYFITSDNDLYACGYNTDGQIGIFNEPKGIDTPRYITNNISNVYSGDYAFHFFYQTLDGDIFCSGRNGSGQLGIGNKNQINQVQQLFGFENKKIIDIQCGYTQTIIVTEENGVNLVYASGDFSNYLGFSVNYNTKFKLVDFLPKTKILSISTGSRITGILTDEPKLYIISYFSKKSPEMEIEDNDNNSNLKANLSSFKIQCGDERAIIFQQKMSIIQLDLRKFLKRKEFTDISLKTNQGFIQAHKIWIETRIDNKLESLLDCLKNYNNQEVETFLKFLYFAENTSNILISKMASEIGFDQDWVAYKSKVESLIDDLKKLYEDKNSKDFAIVFQDEKIQVHKFVLAFRSNLFRGMFLSVTEDKSNQVSDYFSSGLLALQSLIQFLYLEKIDQELDQSQFTEIVQYYQMNLKYLDEINSFFR